MKIIELKIPNLGEAEDTEIIEVSVKKGDKLKKNDPIIVLESEKAAMEVPSDFDGIVSDIKVKEGESVKEGLVFALIEVEGSGELLKTEITNKKEDLISKDQSNSIAESQNKDLLINFSGINAGQEERKIARELSIDLKDVIGSGRNRSVTKDDLKNYIINLKNEKSIKYADIEALKNFGDYDILNQSKIKKAAAKNLTQSWQSIPHVSHFEEAGVTKIEKQRKDLNLISSVKITPLAYFIKATSIALTENRLMNSSLVGEGKKSKGCQRRDRRCGRSR